MFPLPKKNKLLIPNILYRSHLQTLDNHLLLVKIVKKYKKEASSNITSSLEQRKQYYYEFNCLYPIHYITIYGIKKRMFRIVWIFLGRSSTDSVFWNTIFGNFIYLKDCGKFKHLKKKIVMVLD